jgi:GT2 family glycosyltransferase
VDISHGDLVYFLDDDCIPRPGYFRTVRDVFDKDDAQLVGGVSGTFTNEMGASLTLRWRLKLSLRIVPNVEPGTYCMTATSPPRSLQAPFTGSKRVDVLSGAAMTYRRSALVRERFSAFFNGYSQGEDLEMSRRIARDWELRWAGDALVHHNYAPSGRPPKLKHGYMTAVNRFFIFRRHSVEATAADVGRLWVDILFSVFYDLAGFLIRPWQPWRLAYAMGGFGGVVSSVLTPPTFVEPAARKEYVLSLCSAAATENAEACGTPSSSDQHSSVR